MNGTALNLSNNSPTFCVASEKSDRKMFAPEILEQALMKIPNTPENHRLQNTLLMCAANGEMFSQTAYIPNEAFILPSHFL